jgi:hypothetical protein
MNHLGGQIKDQIELVGISTSRKDHSIFCAHPMFAGRKRQIGENAEFHGSDIPGFLGTEAVVVVGIVSEILRVVGHSGLDYGRSLRLYVQIFPELRNLHPFNPTTNFTFSSFQSTTLTVGVKFKLRCFGARKPRF